MLTLENFASAYFKTNIPLQITAQKVKFQQSNVCWLCEEHFLQNRATLASHTKGASHIDKVRDHDHLTGKYRRAVHSECNINVKQK